MKRVAQILVGALLALSTSILVGQTQTIDVEVLSGRPDMVSGESALVRVTVPAKTPLSSVSVAVNATPVQLSAEEGLHALTGLVSGLHVGSNSVTVKAAGGLSKSITLTDHPITGPVFSGKKETPFICETDTFKLVGGGTLGKALDSDCSAKTMVTYAYHRTGDKDLVPLRDLAAVPADAETVQLTDGRTVPFIVRIETGTIDRGIYQIYIPDNPAASGGRVDFDHRARAWNGRLVYTLGGGCINGWYQQGKNSNEMTNLELLSRGYATASSTLNVFGNNCDDLLASESLMMVKEHFVKSYGVPLFTIGLGCSGGAEQAQPVSQNYPGLLDGIVVGCAFPDLISSLAVVAADARLVNTYFGKTSLSYDTGKKLAIAGFLNEKTVETVAGLAGRIKVDEYCPPVLPPDQRYNAVKHPAGARCDIYDHVINVFGRDPATGFALRPVDNVGVQYGLKALNEGSISKEEFLDLNEKIGGYDNDGNVVPARSVANPQALRAAYRSGRVLSGGGNFGQIPIIDYRAYGDDDPAGNSHLRFNSFATRARLEKENGYHDNQVMLLEAKGAGGLFSLKSPVLMEGILQMDQWLTALKSDTSAGTAIDKVRRTRPKDLVEACWTPGADSRKITEELSMNSGECARLYPVALPPRAIAGAPPAGDILKCQLKPVSMADYKARFTEEETARLKGIFPGGVCDWSKLGVDQQGPASTWQSF